MAELRPSIWRSCRALANRQRLSLLRYLLLHSESRVSVVARDMGLSVSSTSQHLRALNARGFLLVRRAGCYVYYRVGSDESVPDAAAILKAVSNALQTSGTAVESVYRTVTACTHPRRLDILRILSRCDLTVSEIKKATGASQPALQRHLQKLMDRGFVTVSDGEYRCRKPQDPLARTLRLLAAR
jgi:DNA-binding transcriptional ArsR family regulator